jgi:hypothetical protein
LVGLNFVESIYFQNNPLLFRDPVGLQRLFECLKRKYWGNQWIEKGDVKSVSPHSAVGIIGVNHAHTETGSSSLVANQALCPIILCIIPGVIRIWEESVAEFKNH